MPTSLQRSATVAAPALNPPTDAPPASVPGSPPSGATSVWLMFTVAGVCSAPKRVVVALSARSAPASATPSASVSSAACQTTARSVVSKSAPAMANGVPAASAA